MLEYDNFFSNLVIVPTPVAMGACLSSPKGDEVSTSSARTFVGASAKRAAASDGSAALVDVPLDDSPRATKGTPVSGDAYVQSFVQSSPVGGLNLTLVGSGAVA